MLSGSQEKSRFRITTLGNFGAALFIVAQFLP